MKKLSFSILIFLIGIFQVQSQNSFNMPEEHKAFKQQLMDEIHGNVNNYSKPNLSSKQNFFKSGTDDWGDAPDWSWATQFGGSGSDFARDIVSDEAGNVFITGSFSGEITVGSNNYTSIGKRDVIVAKFDNSGNLIWLKQFSAAANEEIDAFGICHDESENIYITGYYTGNVTLGSITLINIADKNLFFTKLDPSGEVIMAKNHGLSDETQIGLKIDTDDTGNIYILGSTDNNTAWRHPSIILKYDQVGNVIWEQQHDESFNDIMVFNSNIYFAALVESYNDGNIGNGIILEPKGYGDAFIAKSDLNGNFIWASMGDHENTYNGDSYGIDIIVDENENIYMAGYFRANVIFGSDTLIVNSGLRDGFIVKCSSDGDFLWANQVDEIANDVAVDTANNSFILYDKYITKFNGNGIEQWTNELNNTPTCFCINSSNKILTTGTVNELIFLSQLNNNANEEWSVQIEGNSGFAYVIGMVTDNSGNIYTYNYASNTIDYFGEQVNKGIFICKQNGEGEIIWLKQFADVYMNYGLGSYMAIDPGNENIYITGGFNVPLIIPGGPTLTPDDEGSLFIIKYGINGVYKYAVQEVFNSNNWGGLCLVADNADNIIISGTFSGTINFSGTELISNGSTDVFIAKYNTSGELEWAIRAGGEETEYVGLISIDANDNIYFTGEFTSENVTINNAPNTLEEGDGNIILAKLSAEGTVQWLTSKASSAIPFGDWNCWPTGIKTDAQGYSYIKGWHGDSTYFDNIMLRSPYGMGLSYFIAKFDPDGNTIWANSITEHYYGFDYNQMDIDNNGSVYLGAQIRDTIHFGNDFEYVNVGNNDLFVAKYLTSGELDWVKIMESTTGYNWLSSIAVYDTDNVFLGGFFNNYISFGDIEKYSNSRHGFLAMIGEDNSGFEVVFNLDLGFQFISSAVDPPEPDMLVVMADVLNDNLDFVRNSQGTMLRKIGPNWVNGIGDWIVEEGYLVKMNADDSFTINGILVDPTTPIPVEAGFQFVSYFPENPIDALIAFETIIGDNLDFIRNSNGQTLRKIGPNWVNGIGDCQPGEGYLVKMFADGELIYPSAAKSSGKTTAVPSHFTFEGGNAADPVFTIYIEGLDIGDEVAAYDGETMVGATKINSQNAFENELPVFSTLINGQGYEKGNPIILKVWSGNNIVSADFTVESINNSYVSYVYPEGDGKYSIVNITKGSIENTEEEISVYPNPSKGMFNISLEGIKGNIQIKVLDLRGKEHSIFELNGSASTQLDLTKLAAGVYFIRFSGKDFSRVKKIVIQ
jgi:hypothetical protein